MFANNLKNDLQNIEKSREQHKPIMTNITKTLVLDLKLFRFSSIGSSRDQLMFYSVDLPSWHIENKSRTAIIDYNKPPIRFSLDIKNFLSVTAYASNQV